MTYVRRGVLFALACVVMACGRPESGGDAAGAPSSAVARDGARSPRAGTLGPPAAAPAGVVRLALDGEGLMLVDAATGATRAIRFNAPAARAIDAVTAAVGAPTGRSTNRDCGAGALDFVAFPGGLLVAVQADRFVGWTVRPGDGDAMQTMGGIGLGATRAELEAVYAATIERTTLGTEFSAGGLQGVLASDAASARITDLWAGTNCVAR